MKMVFKMIGMDHAHPVTKSTDLSFLYCMQQAALLGLKEAGCINEMQHRHAEEALLQQYRKDVKSIQTEEYLND